VGRTFDWASADFLGNCQVLDAANRRIGKEPLIRERFRRSIWLTIVR